MTRFATFWRLGRPDKLLLAEALAFVTVCRVVLWTRSGCRIWEPVRIPLPKPALADVSRVAWAVERVSAWVPAATCLTQALAGREMLRRRGVASEVRLGVATDGGFRAHAWLVKDGQSVLGGAFSAEYSQLGSLPKG